MFSTAYCVEAGAAGAHLLFLLYSYSSVVPAKALLLYSFLATAERWLVLGGNRSTSVALCFGHCIVSSSDNRRLDK